MGLMEKGFRPADHQFDGFTGEWGSGQLIINLMGLMGKWFRPAYHQLDGFNGKVVQESSCLLSCSDLAAATMDHFTKPKSSIFPQAEFPMRRKKSIISICSFNLQKAASGTKRPLQETYTPVFKNNNDSNAILVENNANLDVSACSAGHESIIDAVDRLSDEPDLIADGSRPYCLPTIPGKHGDLKYISCHTMAALVRGNYNEEIGNINIIDCRYPYEYRGGHIKVGVLDVHSSSYGKGAMNMYHREEIRDFLHLPGDQSANKNNIIIFHCEFSSERGPKLYRFLRSEDRDLHKENYPQLHYPEVYLLDGGYKAFFESYKELCEPESYTPMIHNAHTADLRHFRVMSKSWEAEEKRQKSRQALRF
ncbi:hypothetical protein CHS0354_005963 [Potamilus streckersoni]|uniref:M-phase inducer phosphatase n=1 Tax=Potamilus streckersoni TaxID=2493646 RepID=A0AAE0VFX9_9BIVA|nr:hypothetical protein CHS0354_005963 [Potamilus streckersoni]